MVLRIVFGHRRVPMIGDERKLLKGRASSFLLVTNKLICQLKEKETGRACGTCGGGVKVKIRRFW